MRWVHGPPSKDVRGRLEASTEAKKKSAGANSPTGATRSSPGTQSGETGSFWRANDTDWPHPIFPLRNRRRRILVWDINRLLTRYLIRQLGDDRCVDRGGRKTWLIVR